MPTRSTAALHGLEAQRNPAGLGRLRHWLARRRRASQIRHELESFTERQLADLGLFPSDIPAVARGTYKRS